MVIRCSSSNSSDPASYSKYMAESYSEVITDSDRAIIEYPYMIGTGIYDITGPPAQVIFAEMVDFNQKGDGIYMRLRSRAFIIKDVRNEKSIVLVNAELAMMSQGIQLEVIKKLKDELGDIYNEKMLSSASPIPIAALVDILTAGFWMQQQEWDFMKKTFTLL